MVFLVTFKCPNAIWKKNPKNLYYYSILKDGLVLINFVTFRAVIDHFKKISLLISTITII